MEPTDRLRLLCAFSSCNNPGLRVWSGLRLRRTSRHLSREDAAGHAGLKMAAGAWSQRSGPSGTPRIYVCTQPRQEIRPRVNDGAGNRLFCGSRALRDPEALQASKWRRAAGVRSRHQGPSSRPPDQCLQMFPSGGDASDVCGGGMPAHSTDRGPCARKTLEAPQASRWRRPATDRMVAQSAGRTPQFLLGWMQGMTGNR